MIRTPRLPRQRKRYELLNLVLENQARQDRALAKHGEMLAHLMQRGAPAAARGFGAQAGREPARQSSQPAGQSRTTQWV